MEDNNEEASFFRKPLVKNILFALAIATFGFVLLNLTFLFAAVFQKFIDILAKLFFVSETEAPQWYFILRHLLFVLVILLITWLVFRTKLQPIYRAIFMTVPIAVVYVAIGFLLSEMPVFLYVMCGLITVGLLYYFIRKKKPWLYLYTVILVAAALLIMTLTGAEI